jgi:UDP-N-acetylmuramate: L-alanyl-gamma-D-glutamyl-meso-diaminopimelate ligase
MDSRTTLPELDEKSLARVERLRSFSPPAHVHVSAICGTGMAAVASLLKSRGFRVTGSDKAFYPPMGDVVRGVADKLYEGYSEENLSVEPPQFVVIGNNLPAENPEVQYVMEKGIPFASMSEVFNAFLIGTRLECATSVVVAGTHGKTTTSAMIATMLDNAGREPGYFIGGVPTTLPGGIRVPGQGQSVENRVVVLEGDEYDSAHFAKWPKFHSYRPDIVVMTSLEFDHADIYESVEQIETEFYRLACRVPKEGAILICAQSKRLMDLSKAWREDGKVAASILIYGEGDCANYQLASRSSIPGTPPRQRLVMDLPGDELIAETTESGQHNALNLVATAAVGKLVGLEDSAISDGIAAFRGVMRRQQVIDCINDILIIEDFAHHPTAVKTTLEGLRESYPKRRLIAVFEPRSNTSRRSFFQERYADSFSAADVVVLKEVEDAGGYSQTSAEIVALDIPKIVAELNKAGKHAIAEINVEQLCERIVEVSSPGDVVVVMSNGDFGGLLQRLVERLKA